MGSVTQRVIDNFGPEDREHYVVIQYCDARQIPVFHVPNSTWSKSIMQHTKNVLLGVRSGVPDLFIPLPGIGMIAIELKRPKEGRKSNYATPLQRQWIETLNSVPGTEARVCFGAAEAIAFIEELHPMTALPLPAAVVAGDEF